MNEVKEENIC